MLRYTFGMFFAMLTMFPNLLLQIRSIADDLLTGQALLCYELQQMRWFTQQLNKAMREKAIVERDLEKIKLKLEKKQDDPNKPKKLNEEDVTKLLVNMVAFETEKSKLCEIEKNRYRLVNTPPNDTYRTSSWYRRLAETCAGCLKTVKAEHERIVQEKEASMEKLSKMRLDVRVELDRSKSLQQENQLLKTRFAEAEQVLSQLSVSELQFVKEKLLKYFEEGKDLEEEEELDVAGEESEPNSTTTSSSNALPLSKVPSETDSTSTTKEITSEHIEEKKSVTNSSTPPSALESTPDKDADEERRERRMSLSDMFKKKDKKSGSATKTKKNSGSKRETGHSREGTTPNESGSGGGESSPEEKKG